MTVSSRNSRAAERLTGCRVAALVAAVVVVACAPAHARHPWELTTERYKALNAFERAQYNKAAKLFSEGNYKAASSEFEKFNAEFKDSDAISYMLVMRGRSLHLAKVRNTAIKVYDEVLDYFGDVVDDAAAALYYKGVAHIENGDVVRGMVCLKKMVEDKDYSQEPPAAGALRRLADYYWRANKRELAVKYWKQAVADFSKSNPGEANAARDNVTDYYIKNADYGNYERWLVNEDNAENAAHRRWVADKAWHRAFHNFQHGWGKYTSANATQKRKDMRAFYEYFKSTKPWYDKHGGPWEYYYRAIYFVVHRLGDRKESQRLVDEVSKYVKTIKSEADQDGKRSWIVDRLREGKDVLRARYVISRIKDRHLATYKEYEVLTTEGKWKASVAKLVELEGMGDKNWQARAEKSRAHIYHHYLHDYEKAVKLYRQINEPPGTLWDIQDCYRRWGKTKQALGVLVEMESSFPSWASRAAWRAAQYYHADGNKKLAIATARKIMKKYKRSGESSAAHQLLEQYGIKTGGGMIDED